MSIATASTGVLEHIDPQSIDVATNVRTEADATLDKEFLDSITANGVIVPIVATRDEHGVHVRAGQRRTLAAQKAELATVPVYVVDVDQADDAQRIVEQLVENDQRRGLTDTDRIQAWKALELDGLSAGQIAKRTGTKRDKIKTGLTVASSDTGTRLIAEVGLTLDQAATLLEFEDDAEVVASLTDTATSNPNYFAHAVERVRQDRQCQAVRESVEGNEVTKGHRILSERPEHGKAPWPLHVLSTVDGERVDADSIQGEVGIAVHVQVWRAEDEARVSYYVDEPEALGLTVAEHAQQSNNGSMTDEQKEDRKTLIANNKEWDAVEVVRREWLTTFFARKTLPKDATQTTASLLTGARHQVSVAMSHGNEIAAQLLNVQGDNGYYSDRFADYLTERPNKAAHVSLAVVIGGIESSTGRDSWRNPTDVTARYLLIVAGWGYHLSPVEKIAAQVDTTER